MCARCHARRTQLTDDYQFNRHIMDTHRIQLLSEGYYYPDGQILEEVYVYGSFLQSKMYRQGVICSDCHEPHSGKIYADGNALCYRCHLYQYFGTKAHHFHHPDSSGASCVDCHMPERNYMVIDPRRDHSIRNPRPDLSVSIGTPNACNKCHKDKTVRWAAEYTAKWYGNSSHQQLHFGEVFYAARHDQPGGREGLYQIAVDTSLASIVRATALAMLNNFPSPELTQVLPQALQHENPLIRFGALQALEAVRTADRFTLGKHLLYDPLLTIRVQAASTLSRVTSNALSSSEKNLLRKSINEYVGVQLFNSDRANSYLNLGNLYRAQGNLDRAETAYKTAIDLEPYNQFAYINLTDLYRAQNRDREGEELLRQALDTYPDSPAFRHALGLVLARQKNTAAAIKQIKKAVNLQPDDPDLNYVYAITLNSVGKGNQAIAVLENIIRERPANRNILHALSTLHYEQGNLDKAVSYARQLVAYWPGEYAYRQLLRQLLSEQEG
jgi:predicted CXXCH cytochrome family protein